MKLNDSPEIQAQAQAVADWIAESGRVAFGDMNDFLQSRGIRVYGGDDDLVGEHRRQPLSIQAPPSSPRRVTSTWPSSRQCSPSTQSSC